MSLRNRLYHFNVWLRRKSLSSTQIIAAAFALIILLGTILLALPAASRSGGSCGVVPAFFTATSATCVTGLVLFDTWTQWSGFGQTVILCLIELGGLGFMTAASFVIFMLRKKVGLKQRMVMAQALSVNDMDGVVRLQKYVLVGSLSIQLIGALILFLRFLPNYGAENAVKWGFFHSISAFCNAGFDILGCIMPGGSLIPFNNDPVVCATIMALVVVGGLGFFVWEEVVRVHNWRKFSVYTKLVLTTTVSLIIFGTVAILILEWDNAGTLGSMTIPQKLLNALFQSVTTRTAGFATFNQANLTDAGKAVTTLLMLIGGSSGSTAGGIKTVTLVVLLLFLRSRIHGRKTVSVFKRTIPEQQVLDAMTIVALMLGLMVMGGIVISATSSVGFTDALYEAASAIGTVGLTAGATEKLSMIGRLLMIVYMYFGRVGILTISLSFMIGNRAEERFRYANTNLLIG